MHRIILLIISLLLCGCGDSGANAPLLKLRIERENGGSVGQYRVFRTGLIAGSGDSSDDGAVASQSVTVDEITEDGVTVTIAVFHSDDGKSSKQFVVPYDD